MTFPWIKWNKKGADGATTARRRKDGTTDSAAAGRQYGRRSRSTTVLLQGARERPAASAAKQELLIIIYRVELVETSETRTRLYGSVEDNFLPPRRRPFARQSVRPVMVEITRSYTHRPFPGTFSLVCGLCIDVQLHRWSRKRWKVQKGKDAGVVKGR